MCNLANWHLHQGGHLARPLPSALAVCPRIIYLAVSRIYRNLKIISPRTPDPVNYNIVSVWQPTRKPDIQNPQIVWVYSCHRIYMADSRFASSQWETALLCNDVSHWLGASLESALYISWIAWIRSLTCWIIFKKWVFVFNLYFHYFFFIYLSIYFIHFISFCLRKCDIVWNFDGQMFRELTRFLYGWLSVGLIKIINLLIWIRVWLNNKQKLSVIWKNIPTLCIVK